MKWTFPLFYFFHRFFHPRNQYFFRFTDHLIREKGEADVRILRKETQILSATKNKGGCGHRDAALSHHHDDGDAGDPHLLAQSGPLAAQSYLQVKECGMKP